MIKPVSFDWSRKWPKLCLPRWYSGVLLWLLAARKRLLVVLGTARMTQYGSSVGGGRGGVIRRRTANRTAPTEGMSGAIEAMSGRVGVAGPGRKPASLQRLIDSVLGATFKVEPFGLYGASSTKPLRPLPWVHQLSAESLLKRNSMRRLGEGEANPVRVASPKARMPGRCGSLPTERDHLRIALAQGSLQRNLMGPLPGPSQPALAASQACADAPSFADVPSGRVEQFAAILI